MKYKIQKSSKSRSPRLSYPTSSPFDQTGVIRLLLCHVASGPFAHSAVGHCCTRVRLVLLHFVVVSLLDSSEVAYSDDPDDLDLVDTVHRT